MNSTGGRSVMRQQPQHRAGVPSANQIRKHLSGGDKENVSREGKLPAGALRKVNTSPSFRARKTSDNSYDRPLRQRELQEVVTSSSQANNEQKKRNNSTSDASGVAKSFTKPRFFIYGDEESKDASQKKEKIVYFKEQKTDNMKKPLSMRDNPVRGVITAPTNKENNAKPSGSTKMSPANLPEIPQVNVSKIKEQHKKATVEKRTAKATYDIMSMELAYNMEYMCEYVRFQMEIHDKKTLSPAFLTKGVTADQRRLLVKYLISATTYYNYPSFILYQAVKIFDAYIDAVAIEVDQLQISALAALWIAMKKDLLSDDIPEASAIMQLAGDLFEGDHKPLIDCERKILMSLGFEISFAEPFSMLALYTVMIEEVRQLTSLRVEKLYYYGCYLIDLSLLHDKMYSISAVHLAAVSAEIALGLIMSTGESLKYPQWSHWRNLVFASNSSLEKYRLPELQMNLIRRQLLRKVVWSGNTSTDFHAVYKKYKSKRYGAVSKMMVTRVGALFEQKIVDSAFCTQPIHV